MAYKDFAESIKFIEKDGIYIREEKGFQLFLKDWEYLIYNIPAIFITTNASIQADTLKKFEQAALNNACSSTTLINKNDVLIISLPDGDKTSDKFKEEVESIISRVIKLMEIENITPLNACPVCKKEATYARFGDNYTPIHRECINTYKSQLKAIIQAQEQAKGKVPLSIICSILGGLIGLLPSLLFCLFTYGYITPLLILVPLGSVVAYYLINAYPSKGLKLITAIIPMIIILCFSIFSIPYMAKMNELSFIDYLFSDGWVGLRKIVFSALFLFGGFGIQKIISPFKKDYLKEYKKFEDIK